MWDPLMTVLFMQDRELFHPPAPEPLALPPPALDQMNNQLAAAQNDKSPLPDILAFNAFFFF